MRYSVVNGTVTSDNWEKGGRFQVVAGSFKDDSRGSNTFQAQKLRFILARGKISYGYLRAMDSSFG